MAASPGYSITALGDPAASAGPLENMLAKRKHATVAIPARATAIRLVCSDRRVSAEILATLRLPHAHFVSERVDNTPPPIG